MSVHTADVIVIGGGNIGSAVAYGLVEQGVSVAVIDEGDIALRSARGNFGLVWFQGKGIGMQRYVEWCLEATEKWPAFADMLEDKTGLAINYLKPGGLELCYGQAGYAGHEQELDQLRRQSDSGEYDCELIDRTELQALVPRMKLGPNILGATFSPHDGHVNSLFLLRAMHKAIRLAGGRYFPGHAVTDIRHRGGVFTVETRSDRFSAPKLILAAGLGVPPLAAMLDIKIPVRPERGQILVTERLHPVLPYPLSGMRQTAEGSLLFGASNEQVGCNTTVTTGVIRQVASRAVEAFPCLSTVRILRSWGALRPLTPDEFPIYHESKTYPGAFALTSHSGVSLAPLYATHIPHWIVSGEKPRGFDAFDLRRFHVPGNT
jgi:glycine/D-amino acid oxidase-like deaminating enzyme